MEYLEHAQTLRDGRVLWDQFYMPEIVFASAREDIWSHFEWYQEAQPTFYSILANIFPGWG